VPRGVGGGGRGLSRHVLAGSEVYVYGGVWINPLVAVALSCKGTAPCLQHCRLSVANSFVGSRRY
jgi:hypothetical protein